MRKEADDSYALQAERALEALAAKGEGNPFDMAPETDAAGFAEAVKDLDAGPKGKPVKKDKKYWAKYFALAIAYNMPAEAWKVLSAHLHEWSPVDVVQVVPLEPILWP